MLGLIIKPVSFLRKEAAFILQLFLIFTKSSLKALSSAKGAKSLIFVKSKIQLSPIALVISLANSGFEPSNHLL